MIMADLVQLAIRTYIRSNIMAMQPFKLVTSYLDYNQQLSLTIPPYYLPATQ